MEKKVPLHVVFFIQYQELLEKLSILFLPAFQYLRWISDVQELPQAQVISPLKFPG